MNNKSRKLCSQHDAHIIKFYAHRYVKYQVACSRPWLPLAVFAHIAEFYFQRLYFGGY